MTNEQLIVFLENQIRLLEKAFEESDGMLIGVDRNETEDDVIDNIFKPSELTGTAKALDPINNEIDSMKELVKTLKGKNETWKTEV